MDESARRLGLERLEIRLTNMARSGEQFVPGDKAANGDWPRSVRDLADEVFFFQAEDGIRDDLVTGVQTCALPISSNRSSPTGVAGGHSFATIVAGSAHTCATTSQGSVFCWGRNSSGQIGDATTSDRSSPTAIASGLTLAKLSTGSSHTCGLTTAGAAYCWGDNVYGEIGIGAASISRPDPVGVGGGLSFAALSAGS